MVRFLHGKFYSKTGLGLEKGHLEASRLGPQDCSVPVPGTQAKVNLLGSNWDLVQGKLPSQSPPEDVSGCTGGVTVPCTAVLVARDPSPSWHVAMPRFSSQPRGLRSYSTQGCTSLHPSASFYLLIPLNIHQ